MRPVDRRRGLQAARDRSYRTRRRCGPPKTGPIWPNYEASCVSCCRKSLDMGCTTIAAVLKRYRRSGLPAPTIDPSVIVDRHRPPTLPTCGSSVDPERLATHCRAILRPPGVHRRQPLRGRQSGCTVSQSDQIGKIFKPLFTNRSHADVRRSPQSECPGGGSPQRSMCPTRSRTPPNRNPLKEFTGVRVSTQPDNAVQPDDTITTESQVRHRSPWTHGGLGTSVRCSRV